ncbi:helix-turn-helix domain-containing protein [Halosolutus gelatinilyticus]|uniref:helix-turn-helix domain-containing protein n=1 Tax=Halosolutus gelatinilyticus TaxID=2931975 RepID=UPI001FF44BB5|nr:helix-turn-helix domain-containing protein [Halosolutus gelatinilyticus]
MVVILRFRTPVVHSEFGMALHIEDESTVELETLVPSGERPIPFFWIYAETPDRVVESLRDHGAVETVEIVDRLDDATLVAIEWQPDSDTVFHDIEAYGGQILRAVCRDQHWEFVVRFAEHEYLSGFRRRCDRDDVNIHVERIFHGAEPGDDPWFGLTDAQREALSLAVDRGYYDIPRQCSTADLADELDISSQAMTERLRRAVANLARHTVLTSEPTTQR